MNKIRHHPVLSLMVMWFLWTGMSIWLGYEVSGWFFFLMIPGFAFYLLGFFLEDKEILICPECGYEPIFKWRYYCPRCGTRLVFRRKVKVKKGSAVPKERIPVHVCPKGHKVDDWDKFCPKCGESL